MSSGAHARLRAAVVLGATLALGCGRLGYSSHELDGGLDATARDAGPSDAPGADAGTLPDAGPLPDAGTPLDAGPGDAGPPGARDGGPPDAADPSDAGPPVCTPDTVRSCVNGAQTCSRAGFWCPCISNSLGAACMGTPGEWSGCRGTGCSVCVENTVGYPCYWENHPECIQNVTCAGVFFTCSSMCPRPDAADMCMCSAVGGGFRGCSGGGCAVCATAIAPYDCYLINHPSCTPTTTLACSSPEPCDARCPPPSAADLGSPI
jgi:hypothetical protein